MSLAGETGKDRMKVIIIATDGDFNIGPSGTGNVEAIAERRPSRCTSCSSHRAANATKSGWRLHSPTMAAATTPTRWT